MARFRRGVAPAPPADDDELAVAPPVDRTEVAGTDSQLPPSRMRGTEPMYGYLVGLELLVVAVLNLVVTGGAGAPRHQPVLLEYGGIAATAVYVGLLQVRNRTLTGLVALLVAFVVAELPKVPNRLTVTHLIAMVIAFVYALLITQRQRKAVGLTARRTRAGRATAGTDRPVSARSSRRPSEPARPTGPQRSARYTPPKSKRTTGGRRTR